MLFYTKQFLNLHRLSIRRLNRLPVSISLRFVKLGRLKQTVASDRFKAN